MSSDYSCSQASCSISGSRGREGTDCFPRSARTMPRQMSTTLTAMPARHRLARPKAPMMTASTGTRVTICPARATGITDSALPHHHQSQRRATDGVVGDHGHDRPGPNRCALRSQQQGRNARRRSTAPARKFASRMASSTCGVGRDRRPAPRTNQRRGRGSCQARPGDHASLPAGC